MECFGLKPGGSVALKLNLHGSFVVVPFFLLMSILSVIGIVFSAKLDETSSVRVIRWKGKVL
jgi:hypothetical protein